jgi:hypothetical protein
MNTYNENLRSMIVSALSSQELDRKKLGSQKNAALFRLYYNQGAEITATEKLVAANKQTAFQTKLRKQVVQSANTANNQLASATQVGQYTRQSITNAAVCASNVQIAATSIVRLAGDIGNIFSILNAADQGSALYKSAAHIRDLINDTAYGAETASDMAMEASMYTSEVDSATLLDKSKSTNGLMNNLLKGCSADLDTALQAAAIATRELDAAAISSNLAEGNLQDIAVALDAAQSAYRMMNKRLNLDLNVDSLTETSFTVRFAPIANAFKDQNIPLAVVQDYYIIVVKDSKKSTFSMTAATAILEEGEGWQRIFKIRGVAEEIFSHTIKFKELMLKDADGDVISYGQPYVAFLLATYTQAYKRALNNFDDYLSAPSDTFVLTMNWPKAMITAKPALATTKKDGEQTASMYALSFHTQKNPLCDSLPEYRCILLPATTGLSKPDFVFDLAIAQQVQAGNYTVAVHTDTKDRDDHYMAYIGGETTDNFGNLLTDQAEYFVLVLTTSAGSVENIARFTDALSDLSVHRKFQYQISDRS